MKGFEKEGFRLVMYLVLGLGILVVAIAVLVMGKGLDAPEMGFREAITLTIKGLKSKYG